MLNQLILLLVILIFLGYILKNPLKEFFIDDPLRTYLTSQNININNFISGFKQDGRPCPVDNGKRYGTLWKAIYKNGSQDVCVPDIRNAEQSSEDPNAYIPCSANRAQAAGLPCTPIYKPIPSIIGGCDGINPLTNGYCPNGKTVKNDFAGSKYNNIFGYDTDIIYTSCKPYISTEYVNSERNKKYFQQRCQNEVTKNSTFVQTNSKGCSQPHNTRAGCVFTTPQYV